MPGRRAGRARGAAGRDPGRMARVLPQSYAGEGGRVVVRRGVGVPALSIGCGPDGILPRPPVGGRMSAPYRVPEVRPGECVRTSTDRFVPHAPQAITDALPGGPPRWSPENRIVPPARFRGIDPQPYRQEYGHTPTWRPLTLGAAAAARPGRGPSAPPDAGRRVRSRAGVILRLRPRLKPSCHLLWWFHAPGARRPMPAGPEGPTRSVREPERSRAASRQPRYIL